MKKLLYLLIVLGLIAGTTYATAFAETAEGSESMLGDVNDDREINSLDCTLILKHDAGITKLDANQQSAADVNKDGSVDASDATLVLKYDAGIIDDFGSDTASAIEYLFYSISDMETFINTGSRNINDYSKEPDTELEYLPKIDLSMRYMSLIPMLKIEENKFSSVEASFQFDEKLNVLYRYYLDNCMIMMAETDMATLEDYMSKSFNGFKVDDMVAYDLKDYPAEGFVLRTFDDIKVIYKIQNGIKKTASVLLNGYAVTINGTWYSNDKETLEKDYQEFMTAEKAAGMAALFSDEQNVFEAAMKLLCQD